MGFIGHGLLAIVGFSSTSFAQGIWYYTIGRQRINQQANFCIKKKTVLELARIFKEEGPRPGYAALDRKRSTKVDSFTPKKIVKQVTISTAHGSRYTISFVKVQTTRGDVEYLVTTRGVVKRN